MTSLQALVPLHANEVDASGERSSVGHVDEELACGFLGDEWIAVCVEGSREITRVTCGGWKRPYDMHVAAGRRGGRKLDPRSAGGLEPAVRLAFAFLRGGKVHVHRTRPPRALACGPLSIPRRTLFPEGHGLEAHSCEMLDAPHASRSTSGAWLVTASEDGSVRASLVDILAQPTMPWRALRHPLPFRPEERESCGRTLSASFVVVFRLKERGPLLAEQQNGTARRRG